MTLRGLLLAGIIALSSGCATTQEVEAVRQATTEVFTDLIRETGRAAGHRLGEK